MTKKDWADEESKIREMIENLFLVEARNLEEAIGGHRFKTSPVSSGYFKVIVK